MLFAVQQPWFLFLITFTFCQPHPSSSSNHSTYYHNQHQHQVDHRVHVHHASLSLSSSSAFPSPPNIIVMLMDDMGFGDLGINGDPNYDTPNLDALASQGMLLTNFYSSSPLCSPSRASLLTGRLPIRNGFYTDNVDGRNSYTPQEIVGGISDYELTLPELLSFGSHYHSALIGKWHLGHRPQYLPLKHGFDMFWGSTNCHFGPYDNKARPNIPIFENNNMVGRLFEDFAINKATFTSNLTQIYTRKALEYIQSNIDSNNRPFFLLWSPDATHAPSYRSEKFINSSRRGSPYGDALVELDSAVGQIVQLIQSNPRTANNTLIFFTSDNGAALVSKNDAGSSGPFLCGKQTTFEGGFRVPGIAWWPGKIKSGSKFHKAASFVDLFPTLLDLAEVPLPTDRDFDGSSLAPFWLSQTDSQLNSAPDRPIYFYRGNRLMAIRYGLYKAHFWTWTNSWAQFKTGIDFCPGSFVQGITTHTPSNYTSSPRLFHLGRDPSEHYVIPVNSAEYKTIIPTFFQLYQNHSDTLIPGEPVLNWCDNSVMHWSPQGCEEYNKCLPVPPSNPYKCEWPH
ncbi:N-acetylgalactosamine-6-sulfatase-like [Tetranychus urticae]|uniref:Sulfatase N-terminal domain-containing protein n=1 Tax=Tetranychus urticae TaxID=32264 RepID=T1L116_TETUR|nr:N-acetylgalactosamine-6-sulfatase-like [Tetranychus urticae]